MQCSGQHHLTVRKRPDFCRKQKMATQGIIVITLSLIYWQTVPFILADDALNQIDDDLTKVKDELKDLKRLVSSLGKQMMLQQFFTEERVRSEGSSGIKQIRIHRSGSKSYFSESHLGNSMAAVHNHANNIRTVGMGEFVAVLNGIEFRTRHNDYRLFMPSTKSKNFHASEEVPFPDVPPEVTNKKNISEQIVEMREWFKAWRDQDYSKRDYRKYFKPILCYLEGAWTTSGTSIDEPFDSDRHFIDARSWQDLHERIRFTSYTGTKSRLENLAFLPTKVMRYINDTIPLYAQWNYRILCQPLKDDLPLKKLRIVDDLGSRMTHRRTIDKQQFSRAARYFVDPHPDADKTSDRAQAGRTFLDSLMEQIPGKDNIGPLYDRGLDGNDPALNPVTGELLDVSKYHRWMKVGRRDAMGLQGVHRGLSDAAIFAAMTTQKQVAGLDIENRKNCSRIPGSRKRVCQRLHQRWTWAFPLEIIYLTPLSEWNPYNLKYRGDARREGKSASLGKNGDCRKKSLQYDGTNSKAYFQTPDEFYSGNTLGADAADTAKGKVCVLDSNGVSRIVRASGTYIILPTIKGVGAIRQRYPIMPVVGEGSSVWKELDAVKDMVLNPKLYEHMRWDSSTVVDADVELITGFSASTSAGVTPHTHTIYLSPEEYSQLTNSRISIVKTTSLASGHTHTMEIIYDPGKKVFKYVKCSGLTVCRDKHDRVFTLAPDNS